MKTKLKFRDLIDLVEKSVKLNNIEKEYNDLLLACRDLGISSYTLNLLIVEKKKQHNIQEKDIPFEKSFIIDIKEQNKVKPEIVEKVVYQKVYCRGFFTYLFYVIFFLVLSFSLYVFYKINQHPAILFYLFDI